MPLTTQTHLGPHQFSGPHANAASLPNRSGVYLITKQVDGEHQVVDVGESGDIAHRIPNHDRMSQWERVCSDGFQVWTLLADSTQRMVIEQAHRAAYSPVCGVR